MPQISLGWWFMILWSILGVIGLGNWILLRRRGQKPQVSPGTFLLYCGLFSYAIQMLLADRGMALRWFSVVPGVLLLASLVLLIHEGRHATAEPARPPVPGSALTAGERRWKAVSGVLSYVAFVGTFVVIGTGLGLDTGVFVLLLLVATAVWLYLVYYKKKHGRPWGGSERTV